MSEGSKKNPHHHQAATAQRTLINKKLFSVSFPQGCNTGNQARSKHAKNFTEYAEQFQSGNWSFSGHGQEKVWYRASGGETSQRMGSHRQDNDRNLRGVGGQLLESLLHLTLLRRPTVGASVRISCSWVQTPGVGDVWSVDRPCRESRGGPSS